MLTRDMAPPKDLDDSKHHPKLLLEALARFDGLLRNPSTPEKDWQALFSDCPYVLSRSLPLRVEPRHIQALGRPGRSEPDFVIRPDPALSLSPRGIIELKTHTEKVLTFPRKDQVVLTRAASTAINQTHVYAEAWWPDRIAVLGNIRYLFVIMGLTSEWASHLQATVFREQLLGQLRSVTLVGYDQLFANYRAGLPRRVVLLVPDASRRDSSAPQDASIVSLLQVGDVRGVELLLQTHAPSIRRALTSTLGRRADADIDSAIHDAARAMMRHAKRLRPDGNLAGYFHVSARRALFRLLHDNQSHQTLPGDAIAVIADQRWLTSTTSPLADKIASAIASLSPIEREVLMADRAHNFRIDSEAVAKLTGTTVQGVYAARSRIKRKLRPLLPP